jgi:transposase
MIVKLQIFKTIRIPVHVSEYYDRLAAKRVATLSQGSLVVVGYPKDLKYQNYRGNGKARLRRSLTHWTYGRMVRYIQEECTKQGTPSEAPPPLRLTPHGTAHPKPLPLLGLRTLVQR